MVAITYSAGEHIRYKDGEGVIVSNNNETHTLTVRLYNGELVTVDRNDLFGMNQKDHTLTSGIENGIAALNKSIKEGEEKIRENKIRYATALDMRHDSRRGINSLFFELGIDSENEITDKADRKKYDDLHNRYTFATSEWIRSSNEIISTVYSTISDILARGRLQL